MSDSSESAVCDRPMSSAASAAGGERAGLDLWRDNRVDQHWRIALTDLVDRFLASQWGGAEMRADRALAGFIAAKDGLSSVYEDADVLDAALVLIRRRREADLPRPGSAASVQR